jgi:hypothetical protein
MVRGVGCGGYDGAVAAGGRGLRQPLKPLQTRRRREQARTLATRP